MDMAPVSSYGCQFVCIKFLYRSAGVEFKGAKLVTNSFRLSFDAGVN